MNLVLVEDEGKLSFVAEVSQKSIGWVFDWVTNTNTVETGKTAEYKLLFDV